MSKAEEFIDDYTRNCSNAVAYSGIFEGSELRHHEWLTPDQARKAVEIAREEMMKWLEENAFKYIEKQGTMFGTIKVLNSHKLVNDLRKAMKDG